LGTQSGQKINCAVGIIAECDNLLFLPLTKAQRLALANAGEIPLRNFQRRGAFIMPLPIEKSKSLRFGSSF
jgi:hypothetical protein